ncbi:MAG: hypothetical protein HYT77_03300 [Deltaproteobacteria bacterium]|nr:hypothetical protein [Deltaproteobacteria bacterium]
MRNKIPLFLVSLFIVLSGGLEAYGPRSVTNSGNVVKWSLPVRIDLESDLDVRGKDVTALINEGLNQWADLSESNVTYTRESLGVAVDADNVCCYLYDSAACPSGPTDDGKNPIVIDDDGAVVAKFFGSSNKLTTLGFAAVIAYDATTGAAVKGEAVFNAACLKGVELADCTAVNLSFAEDDFISFIVHEIGHFLGLNHAQVNLTEADNSTTSDDDKITTMYAFFIQGNGSNFKTPERDDQVGLAFLYPESSFTSSTFMAEGTVFDTNGTTEFACANVIARSTTTDKTRTDAVSFVSGQLCPGGTFNDTCDGNYQIQGLSPSSSYTLEVEAINTSFRGSSGIPPCEAAGEQPTFTSQTRSGSISGSAGGTSSANNFTLSGTSGNVNTLLLPLDDEDLPELERETISDAILAIEAKSATTDCSTSTTGTDSADSGDTAGSNNSSGCSLIRSNQK